MPEFVQESNFSSEKSQLSAGWRPALLCMVTEEPIPQGWKMAENGATHMYRWHFAVWENAGTVATQAPEHQSAVSSKVFSPGGKNPASKAFLWTEQLIRRRPAPGERVNLDPLMPLPCRLKIARTKNDGTMSEYARILDLEAWEDASSYVTPELRTRIMQIPWVTQGAQGQSSPASPPPPASATPATPAMAAYGNPAGVVAPPPTKPVW